MTVDYKCSLNLSEYDFLTAADVVKVQAALDQNGYEWYRDGDEFEILGSCDVDEDFMTESDVACEIEHLLWSTAEIDADATAEARYDEDERRESAFDEERRYYYDGLR